MTVRGICRFPHLNKPDTKFNDKGIFHTKLLVSAEAAARITELLTRIAQEKADEVQRDVLKGKKPTYAELPVKPVEDEEGNHTGQWALTTKMIASGVSKKTGKPWNRQLPLFTGKGEPTNALITGGSEVVISCLPDPYYNPKDKSVGVTLRLEGVQIVRLRDAGGNKDASGFGFKALEDAEDIPADAPSAAEPAEDAGYDF